MEDLEVFSRDIGFGLFNEREKPGEKLIRAIYKIGAQSFEGSKKNLLQARPAKLVRTNIQISWENHSYLWGVERETLRLDNSAGWGFSKDFRLRNEWA